VRPIAVVVLPSPPFVGVIPETHTSLASATPESRSITDSATFALSRP
jgi:hypothetical protein